MWFFTHEDEKERNQNFNPIPAGRGEGGGNSLPPSQKVFFYITQKVPRK